MSGCELSRWNRTPGLPPPGDWVCQWREVERHGWKYYEKPQIALNEGEALIFLHLQSHYGFIVYLGYSLWRKMLLMWERDKETPQPLLMWEAPQTLRFNTYGVSAGSVSSAASFGQIKGVVDTLIPTKLLYQKRDELPERGEDFEEEWTQEAQKRMSDEVTRRNPDRDPERSDEIALWRMTTGQAFGVFLESAIANNQLDVVHFLLYRFKPELVLWVDHGNLLGSCASEFMDSREKMSLLLVRYAVETGQNYVDEIYLEYYDLEVALLNAAIYNLFDLAKAMLECFKMNLAYTGRLADSDGLVHGALRADGDCYLMVQILLKHGAEIDFSSCPSLDWEGGQGSIGGGGRNALQSAAARNHLKVVKLLVEHYNVDLDFQGEEGQEVGTALYLAARYGNVGVVEYLVKAGSDVDAVFEPGFTTATYLEDWLRRQQ